MTDELTLEPTDPKGRRKRAIKKPKSVEDLTPTVRVEQAFKDFFLKRYGCPIDGPGVGDLFYKPARDRKILKDLIANVGEQEAIALAHDFFFRFASDRHIRFYTRRGNVQDFQSCLARLFLLRNGHMNESHDHVDRVASNDAEIDRARRPRR